MNKTERCLAALIKQGVKVITRLPDGWKEIQGATTAPNGYKWVHNCKSLFGGEHEQALLKV